MADNMISIPVDAATARAYSEASLEDQKKYKFSCAYEFVR
jgi:hypothetical protein